jgi:hypothetical protein
MDRPNKDGKLPPVEQMISTVMQDAHRAHLQASVQQALALHEPTTSSPDEARVWASDSGTCERRVGFRLLGIQESEAFDVEAHYNFFRGLAVEGLISAALALHADEFEPQVHWSWPVPDGSGMSLTGRSDARYRVGSTWVTAEIKGMHPYPFLLATGQRESRTDVPGPKPEHVAQAQLGCMAMGDAGVHVIYASFAPDSNTPPAAEWKVGRSEAIATEQADALLEIAATAQDGHLPVPLFDGRVIEEVVVDTSRGRKAWPCGYCNYASHCAGLPRTLMGADELTHLPRVEVA